MKRKVWFAGFLAALLIWAVPVWAEETITYQIDEMGVSVDIPAEFSVFTRGMDENDPLFDMYGLDKETLDTQFESSFIYLNALRGIGTEEIVVTRLGVPGIESLANVGELLLDALIEQMESQLNTMGLEISSYEYYEHPQAKFMLFYFHDTSNTVHGIQYYTIEDSQAMNFTLRSYGGEITEEQKEIMQAIVDSIQFTGMPETQIAVEEPANIAEEQTSTVNEVYVDSDMGVEIILPEKWHQAEVGEGRELMKVKFVPETDSTTYVGYFTADIGAEMGLPEAERMIFDGDYLSEEYMAEILEVDESKVERVSYGGEHYYKAEMSSEPLEAYGLEITMDMVYYMKVEKGKIYAFVYMGSLSSPLFADFETMMENIKYTN